MRNLPKLVAVIKNGHTDAELDEMEERWVNYQGPCLTLAQVMAIEAEKARQQGEKGDKTLSPDHP